MRRKRFLITPLVVIIILLFINWSCEKNTDILVPGLHKLTLKVFPDDAGKVFGSGKYQEGEKTSLSAIANDGYQFIKWVDDNDNEINGYVLFYYTMPDGDMTLTAHFTIDPDYEEPASTITDIDGNEYATVVIGDQKWMAENLRTTRYADGADIPMLEYDDDWNKLENYLGKNNMHGGSLKGTRTEPDDHPRWEYPNTDATNETGFSAYPGGMRQMNGEFRLQGENAFFWTSTKSTGLPDTDFPEEFLEDAKRNQASRTRKENNPEMAYFRTLNTQNTELNMLNLDKQTELSIRCIRNKTTKTP